MSKRRFRPEKQASCFSWVYKCGCWNYFIQKEEKRDIVGLLKSIFKSENYELVSKRILAIRENKKKQYSGVYFFKDLNMKQYFVI